MTGGWRFAAASVIGTSHLKSPEGVCQDSHACVYEVDRRHLVCVVSDGAGSAARAEQGSRLTCGLVVQAVQSATADQVLSRQFASDTLEIIQHRLAEAAEADGFGVRDYACTLLVALVADERAAFWQIGDGAICFRTGAQEELHYAFWPVKGEYANVTEFVTDPTAASELSFDSGDLTLSDVALFSDGLERLALDFKAGEVHAPFFSGLFPYLYRRPEGHLLDLEEQMKTFLASERVNARTDDDKTLILASRVNDAT